MKVAWNIDIGTLTTESPVEKLNLQDFVMLAAFKSPGIRVLDVGAASAVAMCESTDMIRYTATAASESGFEMLSQAISGFDHAVALKLDPALELDSQGLQEGQWDLILPGVLTDASKIHWLLAQGGCVIAGQESCALLDERFSVVNLANGLAIATANKDFEARIANGFATNGVHTELLRMASARTAYARTVSKRMVSSPTASTRTESTRRVPALTVFTQMVPTQMGLVPLLLCIAKDWASLAPKFSSSPRG